MTTEVCKLLEQALSLSVEEQEALADSLISNLGGKVDEGLQEAWEAEIGKRVPIWTLGRQRRLHGRNSGGAIWQSFLMPADSAEFHEEAAAEFDAVIDWYLKQSPNAAIKFDAEMDRALAQIRRAPRRWTSGPIPPADFCSGNSLSS